jgi:hypothetical protein
MDHDEKGPDAAWREFMAGTGESEPPPSSRVKQSIERRGLPAGRPSAWQADAPPRGLPAVMRLVGTAAAVVLAFFLGLWTGRRPSTAASPPDGRYALFVLGEGDDGVAEGAKVAEYGAWIERLAVSGVDVSGEKLGSAGWRLAPGEAAVRESGAGAEDRVTGFFIIAAPSADSALSIARGMPHLRHGGRLVLRPIEPT